VGFVVDKMALGQVFSEDFGFPCQSSFPQLLHNHPHHHLGLYNRPEVAAAPGDKSPTPLKKKVAGYGLGNQGSLPSWYKDFSLSYHAKTSHWV
jgi:hypothetical protein